MASQILKRVIGSRSSSSLANPSSLSRAFSSQTPITATLFPGDGIGPEIAEAVKQVNFRLCYVSLIALSVQMIWMLAIIYRNLDRLKGHSFGLTFIFQPPPYPAEPSFLFIFLLDSSARAGIVSVWGATKCSNYHEH